MELHDKVNQELNVKLEASKSLEKENSELKIMLKEFDKTNKEMGAEIVLNDIA